MARKLLRNDQWQRIEQLLPGRVTDRGRTAADNRLFVEAVLWIARAVARSAGRIWPVEQRVQALFSMGNRWRLVSRV